MYKRCTGMVWSPLFPLISFTCSVGNAINQLRGVQFTESSIAYVNLFVIARDSCVNNFVVCLGICVLMLFMH